MSGGIAQLVAIGAQDAHIVGRPEVSFFRSTYKRHTNFSQTVEKQVIQGNPAPNGMSTIRFERKGDLLGFVYLAPRSGTKMFTPAEWTTQISKIELLCGGQVIDTQDSNFSQFVAPALMASNFTKSVSGHGADSSSDTTKSRFYPCRFSFCENWQSALPLVALQYHDVELRITWGSNGGNPFDHSWECYAHFVYLDSDERSVLSQTPQNMLITQTQKSTPSLSTIQDLTFNHPVKYLCAADGSDLTIASNGNKIKLQINGTDVTDFKYTDPHYTAVSEYYHVTASTPDQSGNNKKRFIYPFCLETGKLQPTGSLNFSRLDSARLVSETEVHADDIYAVNLNVLRIESGMGGLMYSN
jgi:hypothetical protein|tara:strand:- start:2000 stop:3067 length:1068 start_codon:yes stop_codon:yes gene_type:complete